MAKNVVMLGAGAWGTAIAKVLAENGHIVHLWCKEPDVAYDISSQHVNNCFLPGVALPKTIIAYTDIHKAIEQGEWIFEAIPVAYLRSVITQVHSAVSVDAKWVILSKGIEKDSLFLPTQIIQDVLGYQILSAVVSGPSFAQELAHRQFTTATVASAQASMIKEIQDLMHNHYFYMQSNNDPIGIQLAGALKNICALACGVVQGNGGKANTTAYMLTQGLRELSLLAVALGGRQESLYTLAGVGDLVLTCTGTLSKNLTAGRLFAQSRSFDDVRRQISVLPEGINTLQSVQQLIVQKDIKLPLFSALYRYFFDNGTYEELLSAGMQ